MKIYKIAQVVIEEKVKKPYIICRVAHGSEKCIEGYELDAYSAEQARHLAFQKWDQLNDYIDMGYEIIAKVDKEKFRIREEAKQREEENIQGAWWNR